MTMTLYGSALSPYVRAVRATFIEKGLNYEFVPIGPQELRSPEYATRHPFRKLPAMDVDGEPLYETSAIMRYIGEAHEGKAQLQPADSLARARSEQWLSAANSYLYPDVFTGLFFQRAVALTFGMPVNEDLISASTEKTRGHLGIVAAALSNGGLAAKSELALGDILVGAILAPLEAIDEGRNLLKAEPKVASWIGNLVKRPSFATTAV